MWQRHDSTAASHVLPAITCATGRPRAPRGTAMRGILLVAAFMLLAVWSATSPRLLALGRPAAGRVEVAIGSSIPGNSMPADASRGSHTSSSNTSSSSSSSSNKVIEVLLAQGQRDQEPTYADKLRQAAAQPIVIAVMSELFWKPSADALSSCSIAGTPLDCTFIKREHAHENQTLLDTADALYYHIPTFEKAPRPKAFPNQLRLAVSLEAAAYYQLLDDPAFMCRFDAEVSYRTCAQVTSWYTLNIVGQLFQKPPVPWKDKLQALAYVNSNCDAASGRTDIMLRLLEMGKTAKVPVHSFGRCDRNMQWPDYDLGKVEVISKYKFCVAMENSISQDYVTEKVWQGLQAGCIPVYLGSSIIRDIVPDRSGIIVYDPAGGGDASTPAELDALMHEIGTDRRRYEAMLAWKQRKPEQQPSTLFQHLWRVRDISSECALCQFIVRHRVEPQPRYTTCLFNQDWMAAANQTYVSHEDACPVRRGDFVPVNSTV